MCMHVLAQPIAGLPAEPRLLKEVTIRLATEAGISLASINIWPKNIT